MNVALLIAYDGTSFLGWQKTSMGPSIEETLENLLQQILQHPVILQAASRTDRGVHAIAQCVNFFTTKNLVLERLVKSLNKLLPPTIRILKAYAMPSDFHPTLQVLKKEYLYTLSLGPFQFPLDRFFTWYLPENLNLSEMQEAALYFLGMHDFSSFCNNRKNLNYGDKRRYIEKLEITRRDHYLEITIVGNHFLYKMVRNIVGTLVDIGRGRLRAQDIPQLLAKPSRIKAGMTAPAHGLKLNKIYYPEEVFNSTYAKKSDQRARETKPDQSEAFRTRRA